MLFLSLSLSLSLSVCHDTSSHQATIIEKETCRTKLELKADKQFNKPWCIHHKWPLKQ
jgi:hypothetical protein